ncbi:MAG: 2',5' RNA ligase family [Verrucomicrobia bacterium ADurb.Bin070]|nr:MAG: 2',5' RNA ligase family [Verrucomicrobia bacterium ADurb.Bin070]
MYSLPMRIFLALPLPDDVKASLCDAVGRLKPMASEVTWHTREQLHITLIYLGEVAPSILPHVTAAVDRVCAALPPFACRAYGWGFFGTKRMPNTLWAGVAPSRQLEALHERLWLELKKFGFKDEGPDFRPHITLGRCRNAAKNRALVEAMAADEQDNFGGWTVKSVALYESRLTPRGALYRKLSLSPLLG